jgi:hypothetical protein
MLRSLRTALALVVCLGAAHAASGQNLVVNPSFGSNISSWNTVSPTVGFDATRDANGSGTSGSLTESATLTGFSSHFGAGQCLSGLTGGSPYTVGGKSLFVQAPAPGLGVSWIQVNWFLDNACSSPNGGSTAFFLFPTVGVWQTMSTSGTVPAGVGSAQLVLGFQGEGTDGDFTVNFDDINFQSGAAVPTLNRSWLLALTALLFGAGWFSMRKARTT